MLVLTRKPGENIRIGSDIVVTVLGVRAGHVKLGIKAPRGVPVHRQEVYDKIVESNRDATNLQNVDPKAASRALRSRLNLPDES